MTKTTVIMLSWNALEYTKLTIDSLLSSEEDFNFVVLDNGSDQRTKDYLKSLQIKDRPYKLILSDENLGVWKARYESAKLATTELLCMIDNDLCFPKFWLSNMESLFKDQSIAQAGPLKVSRHLKHPYLDTNVKDELVKSKAKSTNPREQLSNFSQGVEFNMFCKDLIAANKNEKSSIQIPSRSISGCTMMIRRDLYLNPDINDCHFEKAKYGMEDLDLSWSLYFKGYRIIKATDTYVHHFEHSSITQNNLKDKDEKFYTGRQNLIYFVNKWEKQLIAWLSGLERAQIEQDDLIKIIKSNLQESELTINLSRLIY